MRVYYADGYAFDCLESIQRILIYQNLSSIIISISVYSSIQQSIVMYIDTNQYLQMVQQIKTLSEENAKVKEECQNLHHQVHYLNQSNTTFTPKNLVTYSAQPKKSHDELKAQIIKEIVKITEQNPKAFKNPKQESPKDKDKSAIQITPEKQEQILSFVKQINSIKDLDESEALRLAEELQIINTGSNLEKEKEKPKKPKNQTKQKKKDKQAILEKSSSKRTKEKPREEKSTKNQKNQKVKTKRNQKTNSKEKNSKDKKNQSIISNSKVDKSKSNIKRSTNKALPPPVIPSKRNIPNKGSVRNSSKIQKVPSKQKLPSKRQIPLQNKNGALVRASSKNLNISIMNASRSGTKMKPSIPKNEHDKQNKIPLAKSSIKRGKAQSQTNKNKQSLGKDQKILDKEIAGK